jgi:hypothetical protein
MIENGLTCHNQNQKLFIFLQELRAFEAATSPPVLTIKIVQQPG